MTMIESFVKERNEALFKRRGDHRDHTGRLHTGVEVSSCGNWKWYENRGRGRSCYPAPMQGSRTFI